MGWEHTARQKKLAPYGEYRPESYRVVVHDTFLHYRLRMAAWVLGYSSNIPGFLLACVEFTIAHHREFKVFRRVFRKGLREIQAAGEAPLPPNVREPESERAHRSQQEEKPKDLNSSHGDSFLKSSRIQPLRRRITSFTGSRGR